MCCNYLLQEGGITFTVSGVPHPLCGTMALVSADNPAANALGGFKEGTSAYRNCRQCMGTSCENLEQVHIYKYKYNLNITYVRMCVQPVMPFLLKSLYRICKT